MVTSNNDCTIAERFQAILADIPDSFIIYTDGSKTTEGVGAAYAIPSGEQLYRLPATSSILTAELVAISAAVQDDSLRNTPHHNIVICTDSMNSLKLLGQMYPTCVLVQQIHYQLALLHQTGKDIHFLWTPSHQDIDGNDQADAAAKLAITHPTSTLIPHTTGSDVKLYLKERLANHLHY